MEGSSQTARFPFESPTPQLVSAVYAIGPRVLTLEFDVAMDQLSLPASNAFNIVMNGSGLNRRGKVGTAWLDATHLVVQTTSLLAPEPTNTTRCADTTGLLSVVGVQAATWDGFPVIPV